MSRNTVPRCAARHYDPAALERELFSRSIVLTRSAHALSTAAEQLLRVRGTDFTKSGAEVRTAAFAAILAAVSAYELVGGFDLASWMERRSGAVPKRGYEK